MAQLLTLLIPELQQQVLNGTLPLSISLAAPVLGEDGEMGWVSLAEVKETGKGCQGGTSKCS